MAERYSVSENGLVYTFYLRKNACWSNGDPLTAEDFAYSWYRALLPETASEYASQLYPVKNAQAFNEGKLKDFKQVGVRVVEPYVFEVTLEDPTPYFPDICAFMTTMPVHRATVEAHSDWASKPEHFVGNGAFTLKEWRLFDRVRLDRNERYWDAASVSLKSIDVLPAGRPSAAFNLYATGQADLIMDKSLVPVALIDELRKRSDFHSAPFLATYFVRFNCTRKPFDDVRVRKAFALVMDREEFVKKITRAGEAAAWSFVPPGAGRGYEPPRLEGKNPDLARKLLAEAGYPEGKGFPAIEYMYSTKDDVDRDIAIELQGAVQRELGIKMGLKPREWKVYLQTQSALDYDLSRSSWLADYNDPNTFLGMFLTGNGNNETGWSNLRYDELVAAATKEVDREKRFKIFAEAERLLVREDVPISPLYFNVGIQIFDPNKIEGVEPNLLDQHSLRYVKWKKRN